MSAPLINVLSSNNFLKVIGREILGPIHWQQLRMRMGKIPKNSLYDIWTDEVMARVLKSDSMCLDVGCHNGDLLDRMIEHCPDGKFHAFEPLPDFAARLRDRHGGDPRIHIHEVALSDTESTSGFNYVTSNPGYSGLLKRHYDRPHEEDTQIMVRTARLDDLMRDEARVDFIKVDVEGAEYQVFLGGAELLARNKPVIVFEHGLGGADVYSTRPEQVYELLHERCGLNVSLLDRWLLNQSALTREGFVRQFDEGLNYYFMAYP